jgi:hypothetical protein
MGQSRYANHAEDGDHDDDMLSVRLGTFRAARASWVCQTFAFRLLFSRVSTSGASRSDREAGAHVR